LTSPVEAGADDGYATSTPSFVHNTATIQLPSLYGSNTTAFFRAPLSIPQGATITSAVLRAESQLTGDADLAYVVRVAAHAADNSSRPTSKADLEGRTTTTPHNVNLATPSAGVTLDIDVTADIQAVVNRAGWASGNYVTVMVLAVDPEAVPDDSVVVYAKDSTETAPALVVDYTAGSSQTESGGAVASVTVDVVAAGVAAEQVAAGAVASVQVAASGDGVLDQTFYISAVQDGADVDLAWSAQAGATGYVVERDGVVIAWDVQTAAYTDLAPALGEHTYRVGVIL
jgi:hypothetical protein